MNIDSFEAQRIINKVWNAIQKIYEKRDVLKISNLRSELTSFYLEENGDLEEFLTKLHILQNQIFDHNDLSAIDEDELIAII